MHLHFFVWLTRYIGDGRREGCIKKLKLFPNHLQHLNFIENQQNISYLPYNFSIPVSSDKCWLTKKKQTVLVKPELKVYLKILENSITKIRTRIAMLKFWFLLPKDLYRIEVLHEVILVQIGMPTGNQGIEKLPWLPINPLAGLYINQSVCLFVGIL